MTSVKFRAGRHDNVMVNALTPNQTDQVWTLSEVMHCVVFLGKTLHSHSVSLHPDVFMGTDEFNAGV